MREKRQGTSPVRSLRVTTLSATQPREARASASFATAPSGIYAVIVAVFCGLLLISNIAATKTITVVDGLPAFVGGGIFTDGGAFLFPLTYIVGDVLAEVYGLRQARRAIWVGFALGALASVTFLAVGAAPPGPGYENQEAFVAVLGFVPRIVIASLAGYLAGQMLNAYVVVKIKERTKERHLWARLIGSTVVGEFADTALFCFIAFVGVFPTWGGLISYAVAGYVYKVMVEVIMLPVTYAVIRAIKKREPGYATVQAQGDTPVRQMRLVVAVDDYDAWSADVRNGKTSVLVAAATSDVVALNARARAERVATGHVLADGVELHDGNLAGAGDWIVTRTNNRLLQYGRGLGRFRRGGRWVHNGDTWQVTRRHADGSVTVQHLDNRGKVRLPAEYVADAVNLAYAATAHRVQGTTTAWYTATATPIDTDGHDPDHEPRTASEVLCGVLARTGAEDSATATIRDTVDHATSLQTLVGRYLHAHTVAMIEALREAAEALPSAARAQVLADPAGPRLARTLADAAGVGANPKMLLRAAYDHLTGAR